MLYRSPFPSRNVRQSGGGHPHRERGSAGLHTGPKRTLALSVNVESWETWGKMMATEPNNAREEGTILVVDDEEALAAAMKTSLRTLRAVFVAHSLAEAREVIDRRHVIAIVLDVRLPDGVGFDLVKDARVKNPHVRILVVTSYVDSHHDHRARDLRLEFLTKPVPVRMLRDFAASAILGEQAYDARVHAVLVELQHEKRLTARQLEICTQIVRDALRDDIRETLGIRDQTLTNHLTALYAKLGVKGFAAVRDLVHKRALGRMD
jgi:DNA-binding NarL/FixJ family response regulator